MSTLDDVISTVLQARECGPDALAAVALSFGAAMELGTLGNTALKARLAEMRAALEATEATVATLRTERDAAREALAAQDSAPDLDYPARAEVWRLREVVEAHRTRAERAEAERDEARSIAAMRDRALTAAVQEREAFSLRLSAAERGRDEARAERDAALARPTYEARTVAPTEEERRAHIDADGAWLVVDGDTGFLLTGAITQGAGTGSTWIPLGADGLPCAWPVAAEVSL